MTSLFGSRIGVALIFALLSGAAAAFPDKPVRVVIGYAPGGASDILFRNLQQEWSQRLGQPVVPEYKPGANGNIANDVVAAAEPDGYTVLWGNVGPLLITPLISKVATDPATAFVPVAQVSESAMVVVVRPESPFKTFAELVVAARARAAGKGLAFGSPGNGSPMHLASEALAGALKAPMLQVPYKGSAPALQDLMGGQLDFMIDSRATTAPLIRAGKLRALAVTSATRVADLPEVPTVAESGLPGYAHTTWVGVVAPAATPSAILRKLADTLRAALAQDAVRTRFEAGGTTPAPSSPAEFGTFLAGERRNVKSLVDRIGLRAD